MTRNRNRNRNRRSNQNPIRVSDEVPICNEIRYAAEALQSNDFSNLVIARSLVPGMHMMGIADTEVNIGDMITFENDENNCPHIRKLTFEEVQLITNRETTSDHTINRVERIGRSMRRGNIGDIIEFIIDECADYVIALDPNYIPVQGGLTSPKKHQLDEDYPHICYKCKKKIKYLEAWTEVKKTKMTEEKFQHLWELDQIEFYCCSCYNTAVRKENPSTYSISTPFRNNPSAFFELMRENLEIIRRDWQILPSFPSPIYMDILQALVRFAEMQFRSPPIISNDVNTDVLHRTIIQHNFDINVYGNEPHIHRRIRMVVTIENHSRFDDIPPVIDLTVHSDYITTVTVANLVAELVFHWASAKVLLKREDEEWISLNDRQDGFLISFLNEFIEERNIRSNLVGETANERFHASFPQFPHIFRLNDEGNMRCRLCGLSHLDLETVNGVRGPRADMIMYDGFHRDYELSMSSLEPHEHRWAGDMTCQICGRSSVDIDAERNNPYYMRG